MIEQLRLSLTALALISATAPLHGCASATPSVTAAAPRAEEIVVLVHGMGRSPLSMAPLAWALEREGYRVVNWGYSSFSHTIPELGARLADEVQRHENSGQRRVHFVGHSLGNVVVRWVLAHDPPEDPGRVVMLAPPNGGSRSADRYARWLGWLLPPLRELQTSEGSTARTLDLGEAVEVGVIAGLYDGKVSVAETHLEGERAHIVVPSAHSFIMVRSDVIRLTVRFLREARFTE